MPLFPPAIDAFHSPARAASGVEHSLGADNPNTASPARFLIWLLGKQWPIILATTLLALVMFAPGALLPFFLGKSIDEGILPGDARATALWAFAMLVAIAAGVLGDVAGSLYAVSSWLAAMYRVMALVARKVAQMGHVQPRRVPTGEMLSVASSDADTFGALGEMVGRAIASLITFFAVAVLVLSESTLLGVVVLVAAPVMVFCTMPLLRPLYTAQARERELSSELTGMATDIVGGLRILRGIGGEHTFGENYARQSQRVRRAGVLAGTWFASVMSTSVLFSGLLLMLLAWLGTRQLLAGEVTIGQLISFFGYMVFLVRPLQQFFEAAQKWTHGLIAARKTISVLEQQPVWVETADPSPWAGGVIEDDRSGFVAQPGELTIIVSAVPDDSAALADRIGRYLPATTLPPSLSNDEDLKGRAARRARAAKLDQRRAQALVDEETASGPWGVRVGGVDLSDLELGVVREKVLVSDTSSSVFAGTLQTLIDPAGTHTREQAEWALNAASAEDVWEALPEGWQGRIDERGRGLSGGQRQRLILARALLADPEILVLVEPTSAVDAHTEARIAQRVPAHRLGETTIVTTLSPLWLVQADRVVLLVDGQVAAQGRHAELIESDPGYRAVVVRGEQ